MHGSQFTLAFIGFGEAAQAFVEGWAGTPPARLIAYDKKTDDPAIAAGKHADYARWGVAAAASTAEAVAQADAIVSVVTADQALRVARTAAATIRPGVRFFDCNSVAPGTKQQAAAAIVAAGGDYVDVAVMSPVQPARLASPLLVSGATAEEAVAALEALGFAPRAIAGGVGTASSIKMIRSIMVKGIEALTAECALSAIAAGVEDEVLDSLDASYPGFDFRKRADYNLDRMIVHGRRRAAEMAESAKTAAALGLGGEMAGATTLWQQRIGALDLPLPPTLAAKAEAILARLRNQGA